MKAPILLAVLPLAACMTTTPDDARFVTYACERGEQLDVVYGGEVARINNPGAPPTELQRRERPTGVIYSSARRTIRGEGDTIIYEIGRSAPQTCTAVPAQP